MSPLAVIALGLIVAVPVAAAEPPAGVVLDGTLSVDFREPSPDGGVTPGAPVAGADVEVIAYVNDFPETNPIQVLTAQTDETGTAEFSGVARPEADGPAVHLNVNALQELERYDDNGCLIVETRFGNVSDIVSLPSEPVEVEAAAASSIVCRSIAGRIVDARGVAHRANPDLSSISIVMPDGGGAMSFPLLIDADGTFHQALPAWGTDDNRAEVTIQFLSAETGRTPFGDDCVRVTAEAVTWKEGLALAIDDAPVLELVSGEVVSEQCGVVSAPKVTLPP
ncbi:MAG TPA: hypothetical protein VM344_07650, partial [Vitreimonas sp.]|nr:hypothetical protein [Vitreimonas sp.]